MKIHFCDLCNESVPQSDIDLGRAAVVKERVICQRCNELMHGTRAHSAPSAAPSPAPATAPPAFHPTPYASHASRARSGGAGAGLAVIGWIGTAAVGFWLFDRAELERTRVEAGLRDLRLSQAALEARVDGVRSALEGRLEADARAQQAARDAQRSEVDAALARQVAAAQEIDSRVSSFDQRLSTLQQSLGGVQRHDQELLALQGKYSALASEVADLGRVMGDLADEAARAAAAPAAEAAPLQPAWTGLLEGLASADDGDRWQAVIALGETRDPAVAPHIVPVLRDADIFVRMAAARILGDLKSPAAVPALIDALADPEPSVREAVYSALLAVTGRDLPFDALSEDGAERAKRIEAWRQWWEREGAKPVDG
jgi:hypothetical protein